MLKKIVLPLLSAFCATFIWIQPLPGAVEKTQEPKRDPADQLFRRAPMAAAARSIVVPLATNLHLAFDAELGRTHTIWSGPSLHLLGPPYTGKKSPFICTFEGEILWTMPPFSPWSFGATPPSSDATNLLPKISFRGISTKTGNATLIYDVSLGNGKSVRISETPAGSGQNVARKFQVGPCDQTLWFLAHAEMGKFSDGSATVIQRSNDVLTITLRGGDGLNWHPVEKDVDYEVERITEQGSVKGNPHDKISGHQSRAYLKIPPHRGEIHFEILTGVAKEISAESNFAIQKAPEKKTVSAFVAAPSARRPPGGDAYYRIEHFPLPKEIDLLVAGMDWLPNGNLAVATWPGEIYIVENAQGPVEKATYHRFARGLNEPMGLKVVQGQIYVAQKAELTRVLDTDQDGEADTFENINADWGFSGHYDAFAFGPAVDRHGNFYIAFEGNQSRWEVPYSGWAVKISPDGRVLEGISSGLRAPNGIASFGEEIFGSDNQGEWLGACKLNHIQKNKFFGFPSSFPAERNLAPKTFDPPAIWFPRKWSPSTSDLAEIRDERFGPFRGQMIVGDFQNALLMRVMLEKVNGEFQGAVWPFEKGFFSGVNRLSFGPDGKLYVGGCQRAWASTVPQSYSLDRVAFTGEIPFEVKEVHALPNGFELVFTEPVDAASVLKADSYDIAQFTYQYHKRYGSPEIDHEGVENSSTPIAIKSASISDDHTRVGLVLEGWRAGYVTMVRCLDAQNTRGESLRNDTFYYTLNQIPK